MLVVLLACTGCQGGGAILVQDESDEQERLTDASKVEAGADVAAEPDKVSGSDFGQEALFDLAYETLFQCLPGQGCFLDECGSGDDCQSGLCVDHIGDPVCTVSCLDECPEGWLCEQVSLGGPDIQFFCVSPYTHLCRPCDAAADCKSSTGVEDVCLSYGEQGSFCGADCGKGGTCPSGYSCKDAMTISGTVVKQCVADLGVCSCSKKSVKLGLGTTCFNKNGWGECAGKRVCGQEGLSACDAPSPAEEECNGLDDDCDGVTDDVSCDDGNACTSDACDPVQGCQHEALTGTSCDDGDVCSLADHCLDGECDGTLINCDDGEICTTDSCDPKGGCVYSFNKLACDDADPCTVNDTCGQGNCKGFGIACDCKTDFECVPLEDGNVCNGTLKCNKSVLPYKCEVDQVTVVSCAKPTGLNSECLTPQCHPKSGECSFVPANDGAFCNDKDPCTIGESCLDGKCGGGVPVNCNDGNVCTDDACDPAKGCVYQHNQAVCEDGDSCTVGDKCFGGACMPGKPLACDDGNLCTNDACVSGKGCTHTPNTLPCDDSNACTTSDGCVNGACAGGKGVDCNDSNPCTDDWCAPATGCQHDANKSPCNDNNVCTLGDACSGGVCKGEVNLNCDDGNPCTNDACDPAAGCSHAFNKEPCNDNNPCTTKDVCASGACVGSGALDCNDDDVCTTDSCDPVSGCAHKLNTAPCNDKNVCTTEDRCELGECKGFKPLSCDDGNPCTGDSCDPMAGCIHLATAGNCDDQNPCTTGDACSNGSCKGTGYLNCDDDDTCTNDACDPTASCVHSFNSAPCDDGNACTLADKCANGKCTGAQQMACSDNNACTDDSCNPVTGCVYLPNQAPCSDDDACTSGDKCGGGECVPGASVQCTDGNKCTQDTCLPDKGCVYPPIAPCCGNSVKEGGEQCDDGNQVSGDGCENDCTQTSTGTVPGFSGELGPVFGNGWLQCEGYLDKPGGDDIPKEWGNDCAKAEYKNVKLVCGLSKSSYRYIDVKKNVFLLGLSAYPESGLIYDANYGGYENVIYATGNHPHNSVSWWAGGDGCNESSKNTTINNSCGWEASNCFGQGLGGERYLWVYVKP